MKNREALRPVRTLLELGAACEGDAKLLKLFHTMSDYLYRYVQTIIRYHRILGSGLDEKETASHLAEMEPIRTRVHNAMVDSVNIFSRNLAAQGHDNRWVETMAGSRAKYANFAMMAVYENEIRLGEPTPGTITTKGERV